MSLRDLFRRKRIDTEAERCARLLQTGRIADGMVLDIEAGEADGDQIIYFVYHINGVDYRSSQTLSSEQLARPSAYAPGATVTVRYDPRQPANAVVA